ncbi:uncharacterized protein Tco025E_09816 [Trypanosoma conorhini]|uniref:Uncharacterized protein n=1 Tax=Trypanosoma conorhini TaxID=83891 RepID=A0A3R7M4P5_9TRYP|nr:uncharacterized protein Tco025E_09816 [Trypanosoma conorhini]RNE96090.1 hypothetical protein Tco025E_09816 [Trypanosoma conorhini]
MGLRRTTLTMRNHNSTLLRSEACHDATKRHKSQQRWPRHAPTHSAVAACAHRVQPCGVLEGVRAVAYVRCSVACWRGAWPPRRLSRGCLAAAVRVRRSLGVCAIFIGGSVWRLVGGRGGSRRHAANGLRHVRRSALQRLVVTHRAHRNCTVCWGRRLSLPHGSPRTDGLLSCAPARSTGSIRCCQRWGRQCTATAFCRFPHLLFIFILRLFCFLCVGVVSDARRC